MRREKRSPFIFGASSLIVIFAVLCIVIFALLSLNTAAAGDRLSRVFADSAVDAARANSEAHEILARIRQNDIPERVEIKGNIYNYSCRIDKARELFVSVEVYGNGEYKILRWQSVRTAAWNPDEKIDVWLD